jgi:DNA invertase Pin-like site-specific DNA recombinase
LAECEHELIRARTREGRGFTEAKGVKLGTSRSLTDHQKSKAIKLREWGDEMLAEIGRSFNVSSWRIARLYR